MPKLKPTDAEVKNWLREACNGSAKSFGLALAAEMEDLLEYARTIVYGTGTTGLICETLLTDFVPR
jgi:hypothetical protein